MALEILGVLFRNGVFLPGGLVPARKISRLDFMGRNLNREYACFLLGRDMDDPL